MSSCAQLTPSLLLGWHSCGGGVTQGPVPLDRLCPDALTRALRGWGCAACPVTCLEAAAPCQGPRRPVRRQPVPCAPTGSGDGCPHFQPRGSNCEQESQRQIIEPLGGFEGKLASAPGRPGPRWEGARLDWAEAGGPCRLLVSAATLPQGCRPHMGPLRPPWPCSACPSLWLSRSLGHARECAQVPHPRLHRPRPREQQPQHSQKVLRLSRAWGGGGGAGWASCVCPGLGWVQAQGRPLGGGSEWRPEVWSLWEWS